jgi:hypothetical protein
VFSCWPLVPKIAGSLPTEAVGIFRLEKFTACLPSEGEVKIICPMLVTGTTERLKTSKRSTMVQKKNPVGARFFAPVQTGPGAHPASCTKGTGSFLGVKRPGRGADHPHPPSAEVKNE